MTQNHTHNTIPIEFSDDQYGEICLAAEEQGLTVLDLISTAALILTTQAKDCLDACENEGCKHACARR